MDIEFSFFERKLSLLKPYSKSVFFDYDIYEAVLQDNMVIVVLETSAEYRNNQNVYGVDVHGNIKWQIDKPKSNLPFANLYFSESGELGVWNVAGFEYYLDATTGRILRIVVSK